MSMVKAVNVEFPGQRLYNKVKNIMDNFDLCLLTSKAMLTFT